MKKLHLSIGDLLWPERTRATQPAGGGDRTELGRAAHQLRIQQQLERVEGYRGEVPLTWSGEVRGMTVTLSGRADGLYPHGNGEVIEEIKSTDDVHRDPAPTHRMQAALYAWMRGQSRGKPISLLLTLANPLAGEVREIHETPDPTELDREVRRRLDLLVASHLAEHERLSARAGLAKGFRWPYPARRDAQQEMEDAVRRAIREQRHLLLEAPTGSGKTAPILVAALKEAAHLHARTAFATSRRAQVADRISFLEHHIPQDLPGRMLQLGTVAELCPEHNLRCIHDPERIQPVDPYEPPDWFETLRESEGVIRPAEVRLFAQTHKKCVLRVQNDLLPWMDVIIGDQNQLADPSSQQPGWFERRRAGRQTLLLVDEAHGLPERIRDRYRIQLSPKLLRTVGRLLESEVPSPLLMEAYQLMERLHGMVKELLEPSVYAEETPAYEQWDPSGSELLPVVQRLDWVWSQLRLRADDDAVRQFREALRNLARLQEKAAPWRGYIDREHSLLGVELVQPGRILEKRWADCATAVAFSATLSPPWHALEELGLPDDRTDTLAIPDLVDSAQRLVLRYTGLSTRYDDREGNLPQLAHLLSLLPDSTEGGWLVFFPSHAFLEAAATALQAYPVQVVPHRAGTPPALAQRLLERAEGPALHLMALGGAMAEGVGWEQADLHGAVVVSPGFHPPSPDRELRRIVWDDRGEDGFLRAYLLPSMARIVQAAGRLLRSTEQRGVILLVGQRFGRHDIAEALPASWRESMMVEEQQALVEAIREWW